jgi:hypothetical protein
MRNDTSTIASAIENAEHDDVRMFFVKNTNKHKMFPNSPNATMDGTKMLLISFTAWIQLDTSSAKESV